MKVSYGLSAGLLLLAASILCAVPVATASQAAFNSTHASVPLPVKQQLHTIEVPAHAVPAENPKEVAPERLGRKMLQSCSDTLNWCSSWSQYCGDQWVWNGKRVGTELCPKTCNKCPGGCQDTLSWCPQWSQYCGDQWVYNNQRVGTQLCPKTCGKCSGGGGGGGGGGGQGANGCPAGWEAAVGTLYDSWPKVGSKECVDYSGCQWAGRFSSEALWATGASDTQCKAGAVYMNYGNTESACRWPESKVASWNLAATWDRDAGLANKQIRVMVAGRSQTVTVNVGDVCNDGDCDGCCSANTGNGKWKLIDLEKYPASALLGFSHSSPSFDINSVQYPTVQSSGVRRDGAPGGVMPLCYQVIGNMPRLT